MFGWLRRKAAESQTTQAISGLLATTTHFQGPLSKRVLSDPYVTGYLGFAIGSLLSFTSTGRLKGEKLGSAQGRVWQALTSEPALAFLQRSNAYRAQQHTDFMKGLDDATLLAFATQGNIAAIEKQRPGMLGLAKRQAHEFAAMSARESQGDDDQAALIGYLWNVHFSQRVRELADR